MESGGFASLSPGTSSQLMAMACASPGLHGVSRSWTIVLGSFGDGPETCLKNYNIVQDGVGKRCYAQRK